MLATYIRHIWVCSILITLSSDIEKNMCSIPSSCVNFSICHWNLNTISAHNFIKISLLRVYVSTHNFNILCLSETYLDSIISSNDNNLTIPGYDLYKLKKKHTLWLLLWMGFNCLFTANFPEIPGTHFIDLGRMKA